MDTISQITGGLVSIEDGNPAGKDQYDPRRKAKVELSFSVESGADMARAQTVLDHVSWVADNKLREMLGRPTVAQPEPQIDAKPAIVTGPQVAAELASTEAKERKTRKKAETPAVDPAAIVDVQPDLAAIVDDAAVVDEPLMLEDVIAPPDASAVVEEDWNVTDEAAPDITDLDMGNATTKRNGELGDPKLIRDLIATFNPDPSKPAFQLRQIPQAQRQDYLDKLAALKKA